MASLRDCFHEMVFVFFRNMKEEILQMGKGCGNNSWDTHQGLMNVNSIYRKTLNSREFKTLKS